MAYGGRGMSTDRPNTAPGSPTVGRWEAGAPPGTMRSMPQIDAITRLTLLPTAPRERGVPEQQVLRRYRLAAVRPPQQPDAGRFDYVKRTHD